MWMHVNSVLPKVTALEKLTKDHQLDELTISEMKSSHNIGDFMLYLLGYQAYTMTIDTAGEWGGLISLSYTTELNTSIPTACCLLPYSSA